MQVTYKCLMKGIDIGRLCGVGLQVVSGLSADACGCSTHTVGAWVNGSTIL